MKVHLRFIFVVSILMTTVFSLGVTGQKKTPIVSAKAATAISVSTEQAVMNEINIARTDPGKYIGYLEDYRKNFKGNFVTLPNLSAIQTNEGTAAVDEAIAFLKKVSKLSPYTFSNGLNQSAKIQLTDLMENEKLGHRGKDGSDLPTRMNRFGRFGSINAENISYYAQDPRHIVMLMIIDDGVKMRSHRKNIFSDRLKVVGIAYGKGKADQGLCVVNFADSFSDSAQKGMREF